MVALPSTMSIALVGHISAHSPHPVQPSPMTGRSNRMLEAVSGWLASATSMSWREGVSTRFFSTLLLPPQSLSSDFCSSVICLECAEIFSAARASFAVMGLTFDAVIPRDFIELLTNCLRST